ncbi:MAG TPA: hypothetical protein VFB84_02235 [Micromonosporaceae bacterium]|nr:hypothetical protein [Micromonosporaceae bacterium]
MNGDRTDALVAPKPPWWAPGTRTLLLLGGVLVLVAGGLWGWGEVQDRRREDTDRQRQCAPGVERRGAGGECVGVTASGFPFWADDSQLANVMDLIAKENRAVEQLTDRARVTIAYLISVPVGESGAGSRSSLRHELEGAYLAQWHHNHNNDGTITDDVPLLRLLVANNGNRATHWEPVVDQLIGLADGPHPLLAVVGLGNSLDTTRQAIARLDAHQIPMVATVITADDMSTTGKPVQSLVRVAPTNSDEAKAAANHLRSRARNPLIVHDANPDDLYTRTLVQAFRGQFGDAGRGIPAETYNTKLPGVRSAFVTMMANICQRRPDVIYYAGRGAELEELVKAMAGRPCRDLHVDIVTGDSAAHLANRLTGQAADQELVNSLRSNITLRYTGLAHPGSWKAGLGDAFTPGSLSIDNSCEHCFRGLFPSEQQDDGRAIMAHDAMLTAITAVQYATGQTDPRQQDPGTYRGEMVQQWNQFHGIRAVPGASGWISLYNGLPQHKPIPILELTPDGVRFITVTSPSADGRPYVPSGTNP